MELKEYKDKIETLYWVINLAIMANQRYIKILSNEKLFNANFPNTPFENPNINHTLDSNDIIMTTTKHEIINDHNRDIFNAWQIALGITGMTSIFEFYLKSIIKKITGKSFNEMGILSGFKDKTKIDLEEFINYKELFKFYQIRHITLHNLTIIDNKFSSKTNKGKIGEHLIFLPIDLYNYKNILLEVSDFINNKLN